MTVAILRRPAPRAVTGADRGSRQREVTVRPSPGPTTPAENDLLARLRTRDSAAFTEIVRAWSPAMLHVARSFVASHASAEEAVQESWLAVIQGIDRFQGRSSLRTWVFHILINLARRQGVRESRTVASDLIDRDEAASTVDPRRFRPVGDRWAGGWRAGAAPQPWGPEAVALNTEARAVLTAALARLPDRQRVVIELRDIGGLAADEVCGILNLSPANQRVLLHRGRSKLREQLETYHNHGEQR